MKLREGFTEQNVKIDSFSPAHAYRMEKIPGGMRIEAPCEFIGESRAITSRCSFYLDITSARHNNISVTVRHFLGYCTNEQRYELNTSPENVETEETDEAFIMKAGDMRVIASRKFWNIRFEALRNNPLTGTLSYELLTELTEDGIAYKKYDNKAYNYRASESYMTTNYTPYMTASLMSTPGETYYGLGERFGPYLKNGQSVELWNEDKFTDTVVTYVNVPFYVSSNHYGLFVDHTTPVSYEVNSENVRAVNIAVTGEELRFHVIYGDTPKDILNNYTALTGRPALPPEWSFGFWLSSCSGTTWNEETCNEMLDGMEKRNIPMDVFHIDGPWLRPDKWCDFECDPYVFKDMKAAIESFHKRGIKLCLWINPYVGQGSEMFYEGLEKGYFLMRADGHGIKQIDNFWMPGQAIIDFTNPDAYTWWQNKVKSMIDMGIDTFKTDFGEVIPVDVKFYNGMDPLSMHNYYSFLYNRCVFEILEKEKGKNNAVLFSRSGTAGSQMFPCNWAGDPTPDYRCMADTLRAGLSYAMSGFSFWSHDISGFFGKPTPDIYKRWLQFGLFSSHSRIHAADGYKVPWLFDEECVDVMREFNGLKCTLMPYIYRMAVISHEQGTPVMRPMVLEFPDDIVCKYLDLQYMFGCSLLVAPIFNDRSTAEFYLPELPENGKWINLFDREVLPGNHQYRRIYDYHAMPVFVKANTLLPVGNTTSTAAYDYTKGTTIRWYLPSSTINPDSVIIPDENGATVCEIKASVKEGKYVFEYNGILSDAKAEVYLENGTVLSSSFSNGYAVL